MHLRKRQESDGKISLSPPKSLILGINRVSSFWSFCESRFFLFLSFCCENLSSWLSTLMSKLECLTDFDTYTLFCRYTISWMRRKDIYQLIPSSPQLCFWIPPSSCMSQGLSQDGLLVDNDRDPSTTTSCYVLSFDVRSEKSLNKSEELVLQRHALLSRPVREMTSSQETLLLLVWFILQTNFRLVLRKKSG